MPGWLFDGRPKHGKKCCGMGWLGCPIYLFGCSKNTWEISISFIFLHFLHLVGINPFSNVGKKILGIP